MLSMYTTMFSALRISCALTFPFTSPASATLANDAPATKAAHNTTVFLIPAMVLILPGRQSQQTILRLADALKSRQTKAVSANTLICAFAWPSFTDVQADASRCLMRYFDTVKATFDTLAPTVTACVPGLVSSPQVLSVYWPAGTFLIGELPSLS